MADIRTPPDQLMNDSDERRARNARQSDSRHQSIEQTEPHPHTIGAHLPVPGKVPEWPFHNNGRWKIDIVGSVAGWRRAFTVWRHEHLIRIGYDGSEYERDEFLWSQKNFVHTQMMVEDRYFYDPVAGEYTVDRYLDDLERRYGGVDSVLIWYVYPNIGIDDRNQTALASDLPGGLDGLKQAVDDFHRRGVKVFLPTMPWDNGTRDSGLADWDAIAKLAATVGADGINGDTYYGVPRSFRTASEDAGHPLVLQPETTPYSDEALIWNNQSWGKASTSEVPAVSKLKWLEPRHMINVEHRWARDRTDDFHYIFFNGIGYVAWENVWGIWNQLTERDAETLRRIATIQRQFSALFVSRDWEPYAPTSQRGVYATRFPLEDCCLWTLVNRNEFDVTGEQLVAEHNENTKYFDVWNGVELNPAVNDGKAVLELDMHARGFGAVLGLHGGDKPGALDSFFARMRDLNKVPLNTFTSEWHALPQSIVTVESTRPTPSTPPGMVTIPQGEFEFRVNGIEVEGYTSKGLDIQYPWENSARRNHLHRMVIREFHIDRFPVTNADFLKFVERTDYSPADDHNFLLHWDSGRPKPGWENKPVTWVSIEDARAYAAWAGKRLPHEWEWQYAAQGTDGRLFPWGNAWDEDAVPAPSTERTLMAPTEVDAHPAGASPFGVMDLTGNVWQWTDEYRDEHTRAAVLRGGSSYYPQTSHWYFPQAHRLDQHGKYLLMAPSKDRAGTLGFRCVADRSI